MIVVDDLKAETWFLKKQKFTKMGLHKGQTNNPAGRPPGTRNKITKTIREALYAIVQDEIKELPEICKKMTPKERGLFLLKVLEFVLPKATEEVDDSSQDKLNMQRFEFAYKQIAMTDENGLSRRVLE